MQSSKPRDTSSEAMAKQDEILRGLGPAGRAAMAFELSDNMRAVVEAGVRSRHPDWEESEVRCEVLRLMLGEDLFRQVHSASGSES